MLVLVFSDRPLKSKLLRSSICCFTWHWIVESVRLLSLYYYLLLQYVIDFLFAVKKLLVEIHEIHFLRLLCRSFWLTIDSESGYHPFGLRKLENLVRHTFFPLYMCREISIGSFHSRFSLKSSSTYFYKIW